MSKAHPGWIALACLLLAACVLGFTFEAQFGRQVLVFLDVIKDGDPGVDYLNGSLQVAVSPDGDNVYAVATMDDALTVFSRAPASGLLTFMEVHVDEMGGIDGLDGANSVAVSPDGKNVYAVGAGTDDAVAVFDRNLTNGSLSLREVMKNILSGFSDMENPRFVTVSPDGKNVYVTAGMSDSVVVFLRNITTGAITFLEARIDGTGGVDGLDHPISATLSPDGNHVYVAGNGEDAMAVFYREPSSGGLSMLEVHRDGVLGVDGLGGAADVSVSPDGRNVYVAGFRDDALAVFSRNPATGRLNFVEAQVDGVGGVDGLERVSGVAVSPDNTAVFAASENDNAAAVFSRNPVTGALTFVEAEVNGEGNIDGLEGATSVALSPDGRSAYVCSWSSDSVVSFLVSQFGIYTADLKEGAPGATAGRIDR